MLLRIAVSLLFPSLLMPPFVVDATPPSTAQQSPSEAPTATATPVPSNRPAASGPLHLLPSDVERNHAFSRLAVLAKPLEERSEVLRTAATLVCPSVVHIIADKRYGRSSAGTANAGDAKTSAPSPDPKDDSFVEEAGAGTLIRVHSRTFVLTNRHVVSNTNLDGIHIQLASGCTIHPIKRWGDADTDIAVLEVEAPGLVTARLGDSRDVHVGDFVLAFGSPFGLSHSVTLGIISAKGRRDLILGDEAVRLQDFLQTDAAINPGNSGGPLVNLRGEVIGMNTAIASNSGGSEGIAFSIPINMVMKVATQLIENGRAIRGYLGVQLDPMFDSDMAAEIGLEHFHGTRVIGVAPESPAAVAGILPGDVVLQFDSTNIESDSHLVNLVGMREVKAEVPLTVYRNGEELTVIVALQPKTETR